MTEVTPEWISDTKRLINHEWEWSGTRDRLEIAIAEIEGLQAELQAERLQRQALDKAIHPLYQERDRLRQELWVIATAIWENISRDEVKHWAAQGIRVLIAGSSTELPKFTVETSFASANERATFIELLNLAEHFLAERQSDAEETALRKRIADALTQAPAVEPTAVNVELRISPSAWMRGVSSHVPGEPSEYDVEVVPDCDGPPEDGNEWIPLYRAAQARAASLEAPQGEPALTQSAGLPGTREPGVIEPKGNTGESPASQSSNHVTVERDWLETVHETIGAVLARPAVETTTLTEAEELLKAWADPLPPNGRLYWAHVEKAREYFKKRPAAYITSAIPPGKSTDGT